ncbi:YbbR-like domain-containing protein [Paenibacillus hodogayensis]|uniref:YbbR-like domain-containing protein n=1 Tax=Paenibacillus hodogayensis TaxID=279208 RepID=A0ABV5W7W6_9BACL
MMDKWLRNPNVVKVIALLLGILLWAVVHLDDKGTTGSGFSTNQEKTIYNVKVTPIYDEGKFHIASMDPTEVMIRLEGKESALKKLSTTDKYQIVLDLLGAKVGENTLSLVAKDFPSGVKVSIFPPYAKVLLEEKQTKEVPVQVNVIGNPANGFKAGQGVAKPNRALLTVPSGLMDEAITVKADVNIENAQSAVTKQVKLVALDKNGKELAVSINPTVVDVEVPITQPFKKMPLQLKVVGEPAAGYGISLFQPTVDQITVYGPQELLNTLDFYEGPQVDVSGLKADQIYTLDIPLKPRITVVDPPKVEVKVQVVASDKRTFEQVPVTIIGQNTNFDTRIKSPQNGALNVTLEGAPATLQKLKAQDVQVIVDVSNLPPGEHTVNMNVNLPQFVKKIDTETKAIVEITAKSQDVATAGSQSAVQTPAKQQP